MELDLILDWTRAPNPTPCRVDGAIADGSIGIKYRAVAGLTSLIENLSGSTNWKLEHLKRRGSVNVPILINTGGGSQITASNQTESNGRISSFTTDGGTITLTPRSTSPNVRLTAPLAADRVLQPSTSAGAHIGGDWWHITRAASATGASNVIVRNIAGTTLKNVAVGTWCLIRHDGTDYVLMGAGSL